jgi:hypothetical protein
MIRFSYRGVIATVPPGLPAATAATAAATAATAAAVAAAATAAAVVAATAAAAAVATTTAAAATTTVSTATTAAAKATGAGLRLEAVVAIDGAITAGLEGDLRFFATGAAGCAKHFARAAASGPASTTFRATAGLTAVWATSGFIGEPLGLMKFLFPGCKSKSTSTIATGKGFVGESHSTTSKKFLGFLRSSSTSGNGNRWNVDSLHTEYATGAEKNQQATRK